MINSNMEMARPIWKTLQSVYNLSKVHGSIHWNHPAFSTTTGLSLDSVKAEDDEILRSNLVDDLLSSIVQEDDHLVVLNKANGIPVSDREKGKENHLISIRSVLPELREKLQCPELNIVTSLSRNHSGLLILSKNYDIKKKLDKNLYTAQVQKQLYQTYLLISVGLPSCISHKQQALYLMQKEIGEHRLSVPVSQPSKSMREKGEIIQTNFLMSVVSQNTILKCGLMKLDTNRVKWDSIEVLMTQQLAPILGDHTYSSRVGTVLGVPVPITPEIVLPTPQKLSKDICKRLHVSKQGVEHIPLHVHLHRIQISGFPRKKSPQLTFQAPLPKLFVDALKKLFDTENLKNEIKELLS